MGSTDDAVAAEAEERRKALAAPRLVVRKNRASLPSWAAVWRDSQRVSKNVTIGPAWVQPKNLFMIVAEREAGLQLRGAERWRKDWEKKKGKPQADALTAEAAMVKAHALVLEHEFELERERRHELTRGTTVPWIGDAVAAWLDHRERVKGIRPTTLREYRSSVNAHIVGSPFFDKPLAEITDEDVILWRDEMDKWRTAGGDRVLSRSTINKVRRNLNGVFEFSLKPVSQGGFGLASNPVKWCEPLGVEAPPEKDPLRPGEVMLVADVLRAGRHRTPKKCAIGARQTGRSTKVRLPTPAETAEMRRQDEQDAALVLTLAFCGMRTGEALALRWSRIQFRDDAVRVSRSYSATAKVETGTKGKENRTTLLPRHVATALAKLGQRDRFTRPNDLVFCAGDGTYMDYRAFGRRFATALSVSAIERHARVHDLRHTFTTDARSVFSQDHVQKFAGHKDARTAARYAHARDRADSADRWSDFLDGEIGSGGS